MEEERNAQTKVPQSPPSNLCVLLSMLGGGTVSTCACVNDWRWHSHNLHLEPWVCVLMSMPGGGIATISTCVFAHVNAGWWKNGRTFLAIKERHSSIIIQMSSESTKTFRLKAQNDDSNITFYDLW